MSILTTTVTAQNKNLIAVFYEVMTQSNRITLALQENNEQLVKEAITHIRSNPDILKTEFYEFKHGLPVKQLNDTKTMHLSR